MVGDDLGVPIQDGGVRVGQDGPQPRPVHPVKLRTVPGLQARENPDAEGCPKRAADGAPPPREAHSEKPVEVMRGTERMFTTQNKIEMFARRQSEGWDAWGLEIAQP